MKPSSLIAPAPWSLGGNGFVLLYHFTHAFNAGYGFLDEYQHQAYRGWFGAVMLVDYQNSDVGPYQELLYMPGLFMLEGKLSFSISKIWVSTHESQWNGYNNWGIPKEVARFDIRETDGTSQWKVQRNEDVTPFFKATLKPWGLALPFSTAWLPLSHITQQKEQDFMYTSISAKGTCKAATLEKVEADQRYFPPIQQQIPMGCLSVKEFTMQFPVAEVVGIR